MSDQLTKRGESLSKREKQVLILIAECTKFDNIAKQLGVSRKTIEKHAQYSYRKIGINCVVEAAHYCIARGWVTPIFYSDGRRIKVL